MSFSYSSSSSSSSSSASTAAAAEAAVITATATTATTTRVDPVPESAMRTTTNHRRPPASYVQLIEEALRSSACRSTTTTTTTPMQIQDIYAHIQRRHPYYRSATCRWRNSVRHALSGHKQFQKVALNTGGGGGGGIVYRAKNLWTLKPVASPVSSSTSPQQLPQLTIAPQPRTPPLPQRHHHLLYPSPSTASAPPPPAPWPVSWSSLSPLSPMSPSPLPSADTHTHAHMYPNMNTFPDTEEPALSDSLNDSLVRILLRHQHQRPHDQHPHDTQQQQSPSVSSSPLSPPLPPPPLPMTASEGEIARILTHLDQRRPVPPQQLQLPPLLASPHSSQPQLSGAPDTTTIAAITTTRLSFSSDTSQLEALRAAAAAAIAARDRDRDDQPSLLPSPLLLPPTAASPEEGEGRGLNHSLYGDLQRELQQYQQRPRHPLVEQEEEEEGDEDGFHYDDSLL